MKRKILSIFIALVLFIPIITKASSIEDLELKWTAEIEGDGYVFNPFKELDPNYAEYYYGSNYNNKFIETEEGYLIIGDSSFNLYDRKKGLIASIENVYEYIEDGDNYIVLETYSNNFHIQTIDKKLNILQEYSIATSNNPPINNFFINEDDLVIVYNDYGTNGYWLKTISLEKNTLNKKSSSEIFTKRNTFLSSRNIYSDGYNYYTLDENYNIIPQHKNSDGTYDVFDFNYWFSYIYLYKYNLSGELVNNSEILKSDGYYPRTFKVKRYNDYYYILTTDSKTKSSNSNTYLHKVSYYKYDTDFNFIDSNIITADETTNYNSYNANLYLNENGLFTYYSYNNQYYKIEDDFSFTPSNSSYAYNEKNEVVEDNDTEEPTPSEELLAYYYIYEYIEDIALEKEQKLKEEYGKGDVYYSYDTYLDKNNYELTIAVTWLKIIGKQHLISSELIIYNSKTNTQTLNTTLIDEYECEASNELWKKSIGIKMAATEENLIIALGLGDQTNLSIYDRKGTLLKKISQENVKDLSPQLVKYIEGKLMVIYSYFPQPATAPLDESNKINIVKNDSSYNQLVAQGLNYGHASYSYIEYYEMPFDITTKTDGNGTVEATKVKAESGEEIKFTITPKEGYVLGVVKVTDSNGNTVAFTDYSFTMPAADVTIETTFVPENPDTADIAVIGIIIIGIITSIYTYKKYKKTKWINS